MSIWHPSADTTAGSAHRMQFSGEKGTWTLVDRTRNVDDDSWSEHLRPLDTNTVTAFDVPRLETGTFKIAKGQRPDFSRLRPVGAPPLPPTNDPDHKEGFRLPVLVKHHGLRTFANNGAITQPVIKALYDTYTLSPEAQAGHIPCYRILPSRPVFIQTRNASYYRPVMELVGWIPRNETIFGERLNPLPTPPPELPDVVPEPTLAPATAPARVLADPRYGGRQKQPPSMGELIDDAIPF